MSARMLLLLSTPIRTLGSLMYKTVLNCLISIDGTGTLLLLCTVSYSVHGRTLGVLHIGELSSVRARFLISGAHCN